MSRSGGSQLPPGWPAEVPPAGTPDWQRRALSWLYDACPPDYRGYDVLRRYPVVLARFAAWHTDAAVAAAHGGLAAVRAELRGSVPVEVMEEVVAVLEAEIARLRSLRRSIDAIERGLRGERWVPRL